MFLSRWGSASRPFLLFPGQTALFVDFQVTGYVFLLHLSCIHHHFTNGFPYLHLLTGYFPNKIPSLHLPSEAGGGARRIPDRSRPSLLRRPSSLRPKSSETPSFFSFLPLRRSTFLFLHSARVTGYRTDATATAGRRSGREGGTGQGQTDLDRRS